jgi:hypothetical protein
MDTTTKPAVTSADIREVTLEQWLDEFQPAKEAE